jgi:hypothetical protein
MTTKWTSIADRIDALDWKTMGNELDGFGCTILKSVLARDECLTIAGMYDQKDIFRSAVVMATHGFGRGAVQDDCESVNLGCTLMNTDFSTQTRRRRGE